MTQPTPRYFQYATVNGSWSTASILPARHAKDVDRYLAWCKAKGRAPHCREVFPA